MKRTKIEKKRGYEILNGEHDTFRLTDDDLLVSTEISQSIIQHKYMRCKHCKGKIAVAGVFEFPDGMVFIEGKCTECKAVRNVYRFITTKFDQKRDAMRFTANVVASRFVLEINPTKVKDFIGGLLGEQS